MSISYKTPSYFSGFSCLGGECEDTCCRSWEVKLDRQHFDLLKAAMFKDDIDKSIFEQYIHLSESLITSDHDYAFIGMGINGYCAMLDDKGLCSIHAKHGVTVLGDVCTMFPRVISRCGNIVELSGALSCPEVVRNCIDDNTPLKLNRFKTSDLPRSKNYPIQREILDAGDDIYSEYFNFVRDEMRNIMAREEINFETRLYIMAHAADKLSAFYHKGCDNVDRNKIELLFSELSKNEVVKKLDIFIREYDASPKLSMVVVHSILSIKLQQANNENISQLYETLINKSMNKGDNLAEILAKKLVNNRVKIRHEDKNYIDKAITRYILNCLYREWFVVMPDLFTYVQMLLVRTSILRVLIYLYIGEEELELHQLKQKIVYVIYNFARNIDQNFDFLKIIYNALSEQDMMNFDFSPVFIRLY